MALDAVRRNSRSRIVRAAKAANASHDYVRCEPVRSREERKVFRSNNLKRPESSPLVDIQKQIIYLFTNNRLCYRVTEEDVGYGR